MRFKKLIAMSFAAVMVFTSAMANIIPAYAESGSQSGMAAISSMNSNIDFGASGTLKINLKPTSQTEVKTEANITTGIEIDATGLTKPVDGLYFEIEVPTKQTSKNQNDSTNIEAGTYLDNFSTPAANTQPIIKSEQTIVTPDGKTIKRIYLNKVDTTVKLELPYVMSFADKTTPKDFKLNPVVRVYDANGNTLATLNDKIYGVIYDKPWLMKQVAGEETNDQLVYGGVSSNTDPKSLSTDKTSDVIFNFNLYQSSRAYRSIVITDTLPTYKDEAGNTLTAHFDQAKNPNWTLSADGKSVTLKFDLPAGVRDIRDYIRDNLPSNSILKLSFPGAKYMNGTNRVNFSNTASLQGIPYNPSVAEDTIGQVPGNEHNFGSNTKNFRLAGDEYTGDGMLGKKGPRTIQYDKNSLAVKEIEYAIKLVNKLDKPMTDIEIIEDVANTGNRLFMTGLNGNLVGVGSRVPLNMSKIELRGYKVDGTYDVLALQNNGASWLYKADINSEGKAKLQEYLDNINQGTMNADDAVAIDPKYKKVGIYFKDLTLDPTKNIEFSIKMMFIDPFREKYSADPLTNVIKANVNRVNEDGSKDPLKLSGDWNTFYTPFSEKVWLSKESRYQRVGMPNERFTARVGFRLDTLSSARYLKNPTFIDLLPTGVSYDNLTNVAPVLSNMQPQSVEFIKNYNDTGRDAVKIVAPSGYVYQYQSLTFDIANLIINDNIIPSKAENDEINNDNVVYFYADNWTKGTPEEFSGLYNENNFVKDDLDINKNGIVDETILKAVAKVLGNNVESIQSDKHIRSLEPSVAGGAAVLSRTFTKNTITTDFSGDGENSGIFQYRMSVRNYYNTPMDRILMYDVLPHVGDGRGSSFSNTLQGPIELKIGANDVSGDYYIYYRTDKYPNKDDANELNSSAWKENPGDYTKVKAIKIVGKNGTILEPYKVLSAYLTMKSPEYNPMLSETFAHNTLSVIYNNETRLRETDKVSNQLIDTMSIEATKKWLDADGNAINAPEVNEITVKLFADGVNTEKTLKITAANNWKATFTHLRKYNVEQHNDGTVTKTAIVYTIKEANQDENNITVYNGKSYEVTSTSTEANQATVENQATLTITNKLVQEKVSIPVKKNWVNDENSLSSRPNQIHVRLFADGVELTDAYVKATDNWEYTFTNLPKYNGLDEIKYTIKEDVVAGYKTKITDGAQGYEITNSFEPVIPPPPNVPPTNDKPTPKTPPKTPNTGDIANTMIYISMMFMSLAAIILIVVRLKITHMNRR